MNYILSFSLCFFGIVIFITPTVVYWNFLFTRKEFSSPLILLIYTIFQFIFLISIANIINIMISVSGKINTLIPSIASAQLMIFSIVSLFAPTFSLLNMFVRFLIQKIIKLNTHKKKINFSGIIQSKLSKLPVKCIFKCILKNLNIMFDTENKILHIEFLSASFIRKFLLIAYLISGLFTISPLANTVIINRIKAHMSSIQIDMIRSEIDLYSKVFVIGALPFILRDLVPVNNFVDIHPRSIKARVRKISGQKISKKENRIKH